MKSLIIFISFIVLNNTLNAQNNVGIGTNNPNPSALVDMSSTNKGVLFPKVNLLSTSDNTTIINPAPGLIIYNTNSILTGGSGLYYNSGTAASPNWAKVGDLKLPYYNATSSASAAFTIENYSMGTTGNGIKGFSQNGIGLVGSSATGTGVSANSTTGYALETNGKVKIAGTGQTPAQGKVLTSDANGNASWEGAIAFSSIGIQPGGAQEFADGVEKKVPFYTEEYDLGNNYNPSSVSPYSTFTAPVKGIYHFDVKISWGNSIGNFEPAHLFLKSTYAGVTKYRLKTVTEFGIHYTVQELNADILLEAGEEVFVTAKQDLGGTINMFPFVANSSNGNESYFNGRLVTRL